MQDIQKRLDKARQNVYDYEAVDGDQESEKELIEVADLIVENKVLLARIDALIG